MFKRKKILKKFAATLKKFSAQGAKKVEYGMLSKQTQVPNGQPAFVLANLAPFLSSGSPIIQCYNGTVFFIFNIFMIFASDPAGNIIKKPKISI